MPLDTKLNSLQGEAILRRGISGSSSQSSAVSMSSNTESKAAPPVPKKPALLRSRQHSQESRIYKQAKSTSSRPPSKGQITVDDSAKTGFPPPPQLIRHQEIYRQQATESDGPPLPPRSTSAIVPIPNGLMDDDNEGASAIPSLQPIRRQHKKHD